MNQVKGICKRRKFLQYAFVSATATMATGWLFSKPGNGEIKNNSSCSGSSCPKALKGVIALDGRGNPIELSTFLANVSPNVPVAVKGLSKPIYLVIENGKAVAPYGIVPTCTHRSARVKWRSDLGRFVCPEHGAQFDERGKVRKGPAERDLKLIQVITNDNRIELVDRPYTRS